MQSPSTRTDLTAYPGFKDSCIAVVDAPRPGSGVQLAPIPRHLSGKCSPIRKSHPLLFGVTQENAKNTHLGAANYDPNTTSYMSDFTLKGFGRWIDFGFNGPAKSPSLYLVLDTVNYNDTNVTGWSIRFGHMFVAVSDLSVQARLDQPIIVSFDLRIRGSEVRPELIHRGYSGHRVMVGALGRWDERRPRQNRAHFVEFDLIQSPGYTESYGDPDRPLCHDRAYDRCFYSAKGQFPEGREMRYPLVGAQQVPENTDSWTHIKIPLSDAFHELRWTSPPSDWGKAKLDGIYIGIESEGTTRTWLEVKNYEVYAEQPH